MLRITSQNDPAGACHYFDPGSHDYYVEGAEHEMGQWGGKGATLLGLSGDVSEDAFKALAYNRDPRTHEKLTARDNPKRRVGYDFTFSTPKSVTLAFELGGDTRILEAFRQSVAETMADIEADALTRDQRNGRTDEVKPGNLTHATFIHRTSRPIKGIADCQLHAHAFVFNATKYDGRWTALELGEVKANAPYYEALAQARLAKRLVDIGYGVHRKGKFFELDGVSDAVIDKFSNRTKLIEAVAAAKGITNPEYKAELGGKTRERKSDSLSHDALKALWVSRLTAAEKTQLANLPGQKTLPRSARDAARFALDHAFEREAVVAEKRVLEHALRYGVGSVDLDGVKAAVKDAGLLVKGERSTTQEMLALEAGMVKWARDGKGMLKPLGSTPRAPGEDRRINNLPSRSTQTTLTAGQSRAVKHILTSKDRVTLIRGAAGTGKTTSLTVAADAVRAAGLPIRAIAPTSKAAEELRGVDAASDTLARFLIDQKMQESVRDGALIVDEASLLGTRQASELFGILEKVNARAVLVGDVKQHSGVPAGAPFRLMQESLPVVEITEVMRQAGAYRRVSEYLSEHRTDKAIDLLEQMGHVHEAEYTERMKLIVDDFMDATKRNHSVLVVAPTHEEGNAVTGLIRERLKAEGKLGDEREFTRLVPLNLTEAELRDGQRLEPGDVLQFHRASGKHKAGDRVRVGEGRTGGAGGGDLLPRANGSAYRVSSLQVAPGDTVRITANGKDRTGSHKLKNGAVYQVKGFTPKGDIKLTNGWELAKDFGHLAHGYVSTSHASQGRTVDTVLVSEPARTFPAASAEQLYVSISRGKRAAILYTDSLEALRDAVKPRPKENASDLIEPPKPANRLKARALFVERIKQIAEKAREKVRGVAKAVKKEREADYDRG